MKDHLELKAYAKINLGLDVVRKREDGYHEVRIVVSPQPVLNTELRPYAGLE